jgi:hypothetical protein
LGGGGVNGALVRVAGTIVEVDDVAVCGQDGDVGRQETNLIDPAFESTVTCPRGEDDLVAFDDVAPAAFEFPTAGDVVRFRGETFGEGGG